MLTAPSNTAIYIDLHRATWEEEEVRFTCGHFWHFRVQPSVPHEHWLAEKRRLEGKRCFTCRNIQPPIIVFGPNPEAGMNAAPVVPSPIKGS